MGEEIQDHNHIRVEGLSHAYGQTSILDTLNLTLKPGQRLAVMGPSGTGKSTLLNCLAGLESIQSGEVFAMGHPLHKLDEPARAEIRRQHFGIVFQFFHLLPTLTARENVELPLLMQGHRLAERREMADHMMNQVGLSHRLHAYPETLSGGERQRAAIARALITKPGILFADEPTGNLDAATGSAILDLLENLMDREGTTFVMVTHSNEAAAICHQRMSLNHGKLQNLD